jgi:hypothetical protein
VDTNKIKAMLASYGRTFLAVVLYAYTQGETDLQSILIAGAIAVIGPAIRGLNPKDPAFGLIADKTTAELNKLLKADFRKAKKK